MEYLGSIQNQYHCADTDHELTICWQLLGALTDSG
jgi:hypothetical protein